MDMDMDMELGDKNMIEVPIGPQHKKLKTLSAEFQHGSGSDTHTDMSSMNSVITDGGNTALQQPCSLSVSDHGSSEGKSVVTTVSTGSDGSSSDESDASSPPPPKYGSDSDDDMETLSWKESTYDQTKEAALKGLTYYNAKNKDTEYEYVSSVASIPLFLGHCFAFHANFFAREKSGTEAELFYVEVECHSSLVTRCEILKPKPFSLGETPPKPAYDSDIFHPEGVVCTCGYKPEYNLGNNSVSFELLFDNYERSQKAAADAANA